MIRTPLRSAPSRRRALPWSARMASRSRAGPFGFAAVDKLFYIAREHLSYAKPFDLTVGPLSGSRSSIRFSVAPWGPLLDLHQLCRPFGSVVERRKRSSAARFRPHLGIAYSNIDRTAVEIVDAIAELRAAVRVNEVELLVLRREDHAYRWGTDAVLALGGYFPERSA